MSVPDDRITILDGIKMPMNFAALTRALNMSEDEAANAAQHIDFDSLDVSYIEVTQRKSD